MITSRLEALRDGSRVARGAVPLLVPGGRLRRLCVIAGMAMVLTCAAQLALGRTAGLPDGSAVRVGEVVISENELGRRIELLELLYGIRAPESGPEREDFRRDAAKAVAVSEILRAVAADQGVAVTQADAREALDAMVTEQMPGGREALLQYLDSQGVEESDVLDEIERQLTTTRLFEKVTASVEPVTDAEVREAFAERREEMVQPEQRRLSNIVVESQDAARKIFEAARRGESFATLAKTHSLDESTRDTGGGLGTLTLDQLDGPYGEAAFSAPAGAAFGPVETQYGWNVGRVLEVVPAKALSLDEAAQQLEAQLTGERQVDRWRSWLAERMADADVEYAGRFRPDDPDAPPSFDPLTEGPELGEGEVE